VAFFVGDHVVRGASGCSMPDVFQMTERLSSDREGHKTCSRTTHYVPLSQLIQLLKSNT
jgi:hypothetical protein